MNEISNDIMQAVLNPTPFLADKENVLIYCSDNLQYLSTMLKENPDFCLLDVKSPELISAIFNDSDCSVKEMYLVALNVTRMKTKTDDHNMVLNQLLVGIHQLAPESNFQMNLEDVSNFDCDSALKDSVFYLTTLALKFYAISLITGDNIDGHQSKENLFTEILNLSSDLESFIQYFYAALAFVFQECNEPCNLEFDIEIPEITKSEIRAFINFSGMAIDCANFVTDEPNLTIDQNLPENAVQELIKMGSSSSIPLPWDCAHYSFEYVANQNPSLIALEKGLSSITYGEFYNKAHALAKRLVEKGVQKSDSVPIITSRSFEFLISMFSVMKAGAAFIPIDNALPKERISIILADSKCKHVLIDQTTNKDLLDHLNNSNQYVSIVLHKELFLPFVGEEKYLLPDIEGTDPAYIVYTSGSTGKPKGVIIKHASVSNFANVAVPSVYEVKNRKWASILSINFSAFVKDIMISLSHGSTSILKDDDSFAAIKRADSIHGTPSLLSMLDPLEYPNLKLVVLGGELPSLDVFKKWENHATVYNSYGVSELTHTPSSKLWNSQDEFISIGKPLPNFHFYIMDEKLRLVPKGVVGQVVIGGLGVAKGYLHQPELTDEKFVEDYIRNDGSKMYLTGDFGKWRENNEIEITGRLDDMVKMNGYRIELEEISKNLLHVDKSIVLKIGNELVAFVTPVSANSDQIMESAVQTLPHYMLPTMIIPLEDFPVTGNGKIDKNALLKYDISSFLNSVGDYDSMTENEKQIASIIASVLKIEVTDLARDTDFFRIGGDSITAISVANLATKKGRSLTSRDIFLKRKIGAIADVSLLDKPIGTILKDIYITDDILLEVKRKIDLPEEINLDIYPCTPLQSEIFAECSVNKSSYIHQITWELNNVVTAVKLQEAWSKVIENHDILRTRFVSTTQNIFQVVIPYSHQHVPYLTSDLNLKAALEDGLLAGFSEHSPSW
ncbi:hypothetical protein HDV02_003691 [Globomyces sp. JEL0801]|nr:hypothetical protein HDV02_003691 [Globomyces sp. JEL0801]